MRGIYSFQNSKVFGRLISCLKYCKELRSQAAALALSHIHRQVWQIHMPFRQWWRAKSDKVEHKAQMSLESWRWASGFHSYWNASNQSHMLNRNHDSVPHLPWQENAVPDWNNLTGFWQNLSHFHSTKDYPAPLSQFKCTIPPPICFSPVGF